MLRTMGQNEDSSKRNVHGTRGLHNIKRKVNINKFMIFPKALKKTNNTLPKYTGRD